MCICTDDFALLIHLNKGTTFIGMVSEEHIDKWLQLTLKIVNGQLPTAELSSQVKIMSENNRYGHIEEILQSHFKKK